MGNKLTADNTKTADNALLGLSAIAKALGRTRQQIGVESGRPGFPVHVVKGKRRYVLSEVLEWRRRSIRPKKPPTTALAASPTADGDGVQAAGTKAAVNEAVPDAGETGSTVGLVDWLNGAVLLEHVKPGGPLAGFVRRRESPALRAKFLRLGLWRALEEADGGPLPAKAPADFYAGVLERVSDDRLWEWFSRPAAGA